MTTSTIISLPSVLSSEVDRIYDFATAIATLRLSIHSSVITLEKLLPLFLIRDLKMRFFSSSNLLTLSSPSSGGVFAAAPRLVDELDRTMFDDAVPAAARNFTD